MKFFLQRSSLTVYSRVRTKICGITRIEDAQISARLGADAIGLNFYPPSPRYVRAEQAREIVVRLPPFMTVVALFVNPEPSHVNRILSEIAVDALQFHGNESPEFCSSFARPYIKAVGVHGDTDLNGVAECYSGAQALLLDVFDSKRWGGDGRSVRLDKCAGELADPLYSRRGANPG